MRRKLNRVPKKCMNCLMRLLIGLSHFLLHPRTLQQKLYPELHDSKGTIKNHDWHGSGHQDAQATASTSAFIIFTGGLLIISVFYMMYRVYRMNRYFSNDWRKEFGS